MIALALWACTSPPLPDPLPGAPQVDYEALWAAKTRELVLREHFETRLIARATLVDAELAEAQAIHITRARQGTPAALAEATVTAQQQALAAWCFVFSAYAPPPDRADDFGPDGEATWGLVLLVDGQRAALERLDPIPNPNPDQQQLYPQIDGWARLYEACFARESEAAQLELRMAGPRGQGAMRWDRT